ncbi:MAG: FAD-dependent oxidoreductase, partial [Nocardioides sp.]
MNRVVVIGGGPGGYEAALVAAQLGADVTVVDTDGLGGSAVLTDCVPSKTLIATAELMADMEEAEELGLSVAAADGAAANGSPFRVDLARVNARVKRLALAQSADIDRRITREGVRVVQGRGRLDPASGAGHAARRVVAELADGGEESFEADAVLVAT